MERAATLSSAASLAPPHFSTLYHKRQDFRKKKLLNRKYLFSFSIQILFETFVIIKTVQRDVVVNVKTSLFCRETFEKKLKYQVSSKSVH